jgi:hypothetical protein
VNSLSLTVDPEAQPTIAFFLHMYQPPIPIQTVPILKRIINNSYQPLTQKLLENPDIRMSININASLSEMLLEYEGEAVIDNLKLLGESNQIEFLETASYHPILPLLEPKYQKIQIELNRKINAKIFGQSFKPRGFFPPELAVDRELPPQLSKMGYNFSLFPSTSFPTVFGVGIPYLNLNEGKFFLLPRNRTLSNDLAFKKFPNSKAFIQAVVHYSEGNELATPIVGMDFETFGEHHANYDNFLIDSFSKLRSIQLSDLIQIHEFSKTDFLISSNDFRSSSWSTITNVESVPYPLWDDPTNSLHQLTLLLMSILSDGFNYLEDIKDGSHLNLLLKSQQSCQLWWQSEGRFGPNIVRRAIEFQITTLNNLTELVDSQRPEKSAVLKMLLNSANRIVEQINKIIEIRSQID